MSAAHVEALCAHGFSDEEASIALEQGSNDVTAALILLLKRLVSTDSTAVDTTATEEAIEEEAVVLQAIYGDENFILEALPGDVKCARLKLPDLEPVSGELHLFVPPSHYPAQPCLPLFVPSTCHAAVDAPGVRVSLAKALADQAARLAADGSPACYELATWLTDELSSFLEAPPPRPPQLILTAKQQARKEHDARIGALHKQAAEAASELERHREREAAAHGMSFEEYLKATDAWPVCRGLPDPVEVEALKARLAAGPDAAIARAPMETPQSRDVPDV